ncbi:HlyIII-domain-containing protein [Violaceomyces palustris]|uniref:HlyIII-domain-containing protein n=1 Tax=Violaceomyces palustris TaxID=1673888 RepID=A0ACD0P4N4_9BASI|nr:HlyIII-domain-containing protein [Violaceomyces palustris]
MTTAFTHKPSKLISFWLAVSTAIVAWDTGYILLRPRSMTGGDLHWIWAPYSLYKDIDYIYGFPSLDTNDGFPAAQSTMNIVESLLNLYYLYKVYIVATPSARAEAPVPLLAALVMTASKTVLYFLNDHYCGWCKTGHNDWKTFIVLWVIPNTPWIIIPTLISIYLAREIQSNLRVAAGLSSAVGNGKGRQTSAPASVSAADDSDTGDDKVAHSDCPKVTSSNQESSHYLIEHSQLPEWARDNPLIKRGYRRPGGTNEEGRKMYEHDSFAKCWRSIWAFWHNETVNIHSHLWGAVLSIALTLLHIIQHFSELPSFFRPISHHPIFYPASLLFTTASGKVLKLASASYPPQSPPQLPPNASPLAFASAPSVINAPSPLLSKFSSFFDRPTLSTLSIPSTALSAELAIPTIRPPDFLDVAGFSTFFIGAIICLGFSATYHTVGCHSRSVAARFNKLDYIGIVVMIVGSFLPALHYGFYCHPHFQLAYSVAILTMGGFAMYVVLNPSYATPAYRPYRTLVFLALGTSAVFPTGHVLSVYGYETVAETMGLRYLLLSGTLYVIGAVLYMSRVPERLSPGRFDMIGSSHQIFHMFILAAAASHYISIRRAYAFWHTVEGLGGQTGKEGVCLALHS